MNIVKPNYLPTLDVLLGRQAHQFCNPINQQKNQIMREVKLPEGKNLPELEKECLELQEQYNNELNRFKKKGAN